MKKVIFTIAIVCAAAGISFGQTTATDFTASDCNSTSHTLFSELNNGKIIVMVWVMPCSACEGPAKAAYNAVQSFATSHPGKVQYYLIDDYGDASCTVLSNWVSSKNIGSLSNMTVFSNAGNVINMNSYGAPGMPKVVVVGGNGHEIYYNQNNGAANDQAGITAAINSAIGTTGITSVRNEILFSVTPNPAGQEVRVSYTKAIQRITIVNTQGQLVKEEKYESGKLNPSINVGSLVAGSYIILVNDVDLKSGVQQFIKQ